MSQTYLIKQGVEPLFFRVWNHHIIKHLPNVPVDNRGLEFVAQEFTFESTSGTFSDLSLMIDSNSLFRAHILEFAKQIFLVDGEVGDERLDQALIANHPVAWKRRKVAITAVAAKGGHRFCLALVLASQYSMGVI